MTDLDAITDPAALRAALLALRDRPDPAATTTLVRLATGATELSVRVCAIEALGAYRAWAEVAGPALVSALADEDELVRSESADKLGLLGYGPAAVPLVGALSDESAVVRAGAAESLGDLVAPADPAAVVVREALARTIRVDPDEAVRAYAAASLGLLGGPGDQLAELVVAEKSAWVRAELAAAGYRTGAEGLSSVVSAFSAADEELATRLLNLLDDLVVRTPVRPAEADVRVLGIALVEAGARFPLLRAYAEEVAQRWRRRAGDPPA